MKAQYLILLDWIFVEGQKILITTHPNPGKNKEIVEWYLLFPSLTFDLCISFLFYARLFKTPSMLEGKLQRLLRLRYIL
jgi:hypothetical protein